MNIEDLITSLALSGNISLTPRESELIYSFLDQLGRGIGFTEKQAAVAITVLANYQYSLSAAIKQDVEKFLENPSYRYPFRKLNTVKKMSIQPHHVYGRSVKVEFPFNELYLSKIRTARTTLEDAQWDKEEKAWFFPLTENSIHFLSEMIKHERFECDDEFQSYIDQSAEIFKEIDQHIPMLVLEQNIPKFKNISSFVPELSTNDIRASLFEARRKGITTWSDEVSKFLDNSDIHPFVKEFLTTDPSSILQCNSEKFPIDCIGDIVKYLSPCLFVIPGGDELSKLKLSYKFLNVQGITDAEISVMFRLDTDVSAEFNIFVKEKQINSPINQDTKIVFISSKIPKPVLQSNIKFNSIINLGIGGVHYSIKSFLDFHENLINYSARKNKKEVLVVNL